MPELGGPQISHDDIVAVLRRQQAYTDLSDEELGIFADAQLRTKGSAARVALASYSSANQLVHARSRVLQAKTTIPMVLTAGEKNLVRTIYPERDIVFTDFERHDHGLAAAMRKIDRAVIRERLPLRGNVVDVGGDYVYNLLSEQEPVHSCCPVIDGKDRFRQVERQRRLKHICADASVGSVVRQRVKDFLDDEGKRPAWVCGKKAQDCTYAADHLIMTHVYDMTLEDAARAVLSHGAKTLSGCVILSADMLDNDRGCLPSVNGWFSLDRASQVMTYGTNNGSSWHYKHDWTQLRRFAFDCILEVSGRTVVYRVQEVRGQTIFFEMWPIQRREMLVNLPRRAFQVSGGPWALVHGYQFVAPRGTEAYSRPRPVAMRYPWETWCRAMEYARGQIANNRFTLEDYARKMRTMTARLTVNSVSVGGLDPVGEDKFADFLANSALAALYEVEKEKVDVAAAVHDVHTRRQAVGPWVRTLRGFSALISSPWVERTQWLTGLVGRLRGAILDRMRVVTFERDDGTRTHDVSQLPHGVIALLPDTSIPDDSSYDDYASGSTSEVLDYMIVACMRDTQLADRMREVLDVAMRTPPDKPTEDYERFITDLVHVVSTAEDAESPQTGSVPTTATVCGVKTVDSATLVAPNTVGAADVSGIVEFTMDPVDGQNQEEARRVANDLGVTDLIPSDEVGAFNIDSAVANDYYRGAMVEAIRLYHAEERRALSECTTVFGKTTTGGRPDKTLLRLFQGDGMRPDYYDVIKGRIVGTSYLGHPSELFCHAAVFVPMKMAIFRVDRDEDELSIVGLSSYTGLCMVIKDLSIYNGPEVRDAISRALELFDVNRFCIVIRDGVPGCGKTTQIINSARHDDLILASGRENTIATRRKKIEVDRDLAHEAARTGMRFVPFQNPGKRIRTYDSYLVSRVHERAEVVHADECFMEHCGKLMAVAVLSGARRVEFHGDTKQVPYVNRHVEESCFRSRLIYRHLHVNRYISHRCPQDAVAAIAPQYDYKIRTTSKVVQSLGISTDVPLDAVVWDTEKKYLTFYQDDKASALKKCYRGGVNTVAESQGETYEHVVFVRQQARAQELYDKWPYVLVGLSRHTKTMDYLAPAATSSLMEKRVSLVKNNEEYCRQFGDVSSAGRPVNVKL